MGGQALTSSFAPISQTSLNGGLNSSSAPLELRDNEAQDLLNIDFDKFGSILKRKGYDTLNSSAITNSPASDGLHWYEYNSSGTLTRKAINVADGKLWKMDDLDGTWDDISGSLTITAGNHCDFENFLNEVYITNGVNAPFKWTGTGNGAVMTVPSGLTTAKFVVQFNNYLLLANVTVSGTKHGSRFYWSNLKDTGTWESTDFIDVAKDDGQEISGFKVLGDRIVVYKGRSIYTVFFSGSNDIPFTLPGGGKTNSSVGCIAPFSIQEVENGHVFLSTDGLYYFDGNNSFKISDRITETLDGYNPNRKDDAVSLVYRKKNVYMCAFSSGSGTEHDYVVVWNYFLNAFSIYDGMSVSSMATFFVSGLNEQIYFGDYDGFVYQMDTGVNDNPLGVETAINAYYRTNWKHYQNLVNKKGVPSVFIYYLSNSATLTFSYSYDFQDGDQYSTQFDMSSGGATYGTAIYDSSVYAGSGGAIKRRDLTGRGHLVSFKFSNNVVDEAFRVEGFGSEAYLETNV